MTLGLITFAPEIQSKILNLNSSLVPLKKGGEEELTTIYADPSNAPRDQAVGDTSATTPGGGGGLGSGVGTGPPSATPVVGGRGSGTARVGEGTSLPSVKVVGPGLGPGHAPRGAGRDLGGGGMIAGDVTFDSGDVGAALDQLAREILRHLPQHKLTVVWLFDESESMKDDQKAIREKFDPDQQRAQGQRRRVEEEGPAADPRDRRLRQRHPLRAREADGQHRPDRPGDRPAPGRASGVENTMTAVRGVIEHYSGLIRKDRKLLIVLVTDESGDDGGYVEEARQAAVSKGVPIYVIGRQSLFGYPFAGSSTSTR